MKTFPKKAEAYIDGSLLFNKFGVVNLNVVRTHLTEKISDADLKKLIRNRFAKEMVDEKIEFI